MSKTVCSLFFFFLETVPAKRTVNNYLSQEEIVLTK